MRLPTYSTYLFCSSNTLKNSTDVFLLIGISVTWRLSAKLRHLPFVVTCCDQAWKHGAGGRLSFYGCGCGCHFQILGSDDRNLFFLLPGVLFLGSSIHLSFHPSILLPGLRSAGWSCYPHPRHDLFGLRIPIRIPRWVKDEYPRNPDSAPWKARFTGGNQPSLHNLEDGGYNEL